MVTLLTQPRPAPPRLKSIYRGTGTAPTNGHHIPQPRRSSLDPRWEGWQQAGKYAAHKDKVENRVTADELKETG